MKKIFNIYFNFVILLLFSFNSVNAEDKKENSLLPEDLIIQLSKDTLMTVKNDSDLREGNNEKLYKFVNESLIPHIDLRLMTSATIGPKWRQITEEQKEGIINSFKDLLILTYMNVLTQFYESEVIVHSSKLKPEDKDTTLKVEIINKGNEPIPLDFRLRKNKGGEWKVYNINVLGLWIVETYRTQFVSEINKNGIDGLIKTLNEKSKYIKEKNKEK